MAERYHTEYYHFDDGVPHVQGKPSLLWKNQYLFYKEIYIKTEHRKLEDKYWLEKISETGWRKNVVVKNVSPINLNLIKDLNTNKSNPQKINICNLSSNKDLVSRVSCFYPHFYLQLLRRRKKKPGKENISKHELIV